MVWAYGVCVCKNHSKRLEVLLGNSAIYDTTHHILEEAANIYREMRGGGGYCSVATQYVLGMHGRCVRVPLAMFLIAKKSDCVHKLAAV